MAALESMTVTQLKEFAKSQSIKAPSSLKKADLCAYITGVLHERSQGIQKAPKTAMMALNHIQPLYPERDVDWLVHLHVHGWAVAPIPNWNANFTSDFLDWFQRCCPRFSPGDRSTWIDANMPQRLHGILKHYFGHTELQWQIRELCHSIFERIWGTPELLSSFDGGCFMTAQKNLSNSSFKQWIHNDTPRQFTGQGMICVQGIVNFEDNTFEDGGLVLVEGSHTVFDDYMARHPSEGIAWAPADISDPALAQRKIVKICARAGHIILFDGRMFHCNVHPTNPDAVRMCTYVSMQPRAGASPAELAKRIKLYQKGRLTGHWCYGPWFKETPEHPHTFGNTANQVRPAVIEIADLNHMRRKLIGYD